VDEPLDAQLTLTFFLPQPEEEEEGNFGNSTSADSSQTSSYLELLLAAKFWIEGVGILVVGSVGLAINCLALAIVFRKQVS